MADSKIRVLVIPSWYPPDGGQFFQDHAEALVSAGYGVDLIVNRVVGLRQLSLSGFHQIKRFHYGELNGTGLIRSTYFKIPKSEMWNARRWSRSTVKLFRKYQKQFGRPDLIIAHSSIWAGYAASQISIEHEIPYILVEHRSRFTILTPEAESLLKASYDSLLQSAFSTATRIVVVSDALRTGLKKYQVGEDKMISIPNLVDTDFFSPPADGDYRKDPFTILSIGRLDPEKGMDLLLRAFSRFSSSHPNSVLRIIGHGREKEKLLHLARKEDITERVHFLGQLDQSSLLQELQKASMLAVASRFEAFGVVFIEAMSVGLPVLATRAGGPQTFIPEFAGEVVSTDESEAVYEALEKIYRTLDDYDAEKIRKYVLDHFSKTAVMNRYTDLISGILND